MAIDYLLPESRKHFTGMKQTIEGGRAIAFVGAGMSRRAGFADWDALLDQLWGTEPTHRQALATEDMPWRADEAREHFGATTYEQHLEDYFGKKPTVDAAIEHFAKLPFRHVITTNYDRSIEVASKGAFKRMNWRLPGVAREVLESFQEPRSDERFLIYLHGRYDAPSSIVLGERDYRDSYVRSDETFRKLFAIFSIHPVVFFGCSFRDLDVLSIFRQVFAATESVRHYAVLPIADDAARVSLRLKKRYGIAPVFYEPGGAQHPNFERLILALTRPSEAKFRPSRRSIDKDDPQKGRFGGKAEQNDRRLTAKVTADHGNPGWFDVRIEVRATKGPRLRGRVDLWVHPTFPQEHYQVQARAGVAKLKLSAYGAFTVGAKCDAGHTALELDLSKLKNAPAEFKAN